MSDTMRPESASGEPELTEKQRRVLDAAMEVFAEKGYAAASTAEIAKRAGVAEGTVFKTYKTKKDLLLGVVAPFFVKRIAPHVIGDVKQILTAPHASLEDFLRAILVNRMHFITHHERLMRIAFQEVPFHEEIRAIAKRVLVEQLLPDGIAMVQRFQQMGEVRADADPRSVLRIIAGSFLSYAILRTLIAPEHDWNDAVEVELMVQVLSRGLAPASTPMEKS